MREIHGIADAERRMMIERESQTVCVRDGKDGMVTIEISEKNYAAGLTPEQARFIAARLIAAAKRVELVKRREKREQSA
jgi:hypothetical protein